MKEMQAINGIILMNVFSTFFLDKDIENLLKYLFAIVMYFLYFSPFIFTILVSLAARYGMKKEEMQSEQNNFEMDYQQDNKLLSKKLYELKQQHPEWGYRDIADHTNIPRSTVYHLIKQYEKELKKKGKT